MIVCAFGVPAAYSHYCYALLHRLVLAEHPDAMMVTGTRPEHFAEALRGRGGRSVLLCSDSPDPRIIEALVRIKVPIAFFVEDRHDSVGYIMTANGDNVRTAIQMYSQSVACIAPFVEAFNVTLLRRPRSDTPFSMVVDGLLDAVQLSISEESIARVMADLSLPDAVPERQTLGDQLARHRPAARQPGEYRRLLSPDESALIEDGLSSYEDILEGRETVFHWPARLFRDAQRPDEPVEGPIDLIGPARGLVFGPQLHLYQGRWRASVAFRIADNLSGNILRVDAISDNKICNSGEGALPPYGVFSFDIDFVVRDPLMPCSVLLANKAGAIEGSLEVLSAQVRELGDDEEFQTYSVS